MNEKITRLEAPIKTSLRYNFHSLVDGPINLSLYLDNLTDISNQLLLTFDYSGIFQQMSLITSGIIPQSHSYIESASKTWPFFIVENSEICKWLAYESAGINKPEDFKHYVIVTKNVIFDIVSGADPFFNIVAKDKKKKHFCSYPNTLNKEKNLLEYEELSGLLATIQRHNNSEAPIEYIIERLEFRSEGILEHDAAWSKQFNEYIEKIRINKALHNKVNIESTLNQMQKIIKEKMKLYEPYLEDTVYE